MAISGADFGGAEVVFKTTETASEHIPHHHVDSSALPTGASTAAHQVTQNTALADILAKIIAAPATEATLADIEGDVDTLVARTPALGQAAMAASRPVVIASDQSAVPVSLSALPALAAGTANIGDVDVLTLPAIPAGTNTIGAVRCASAHGDTWIDNVASNASSTHSIAAAVLDGMNELRARLQLPAGCEGTLDFEGSLDGTDWYPEPPDPAIVRGLVTSQVELGTGATANRITLTAPAATVRVLVAYDSPSPYWRVVYTRSGSGGAADGFVGKYFVRAA